jgi:hypothetical protein
VCCQNVDKADGWSGRAGSWRRVFFIGAARPIFIYPILDAFRVEFLLCCTSVWLVDQIIIPPPVNNGGGTTSKPNKGSGDGEATRRSFLSFVSDALLSPFVA